MKAFPQHLYASQQFQALAKGCGAVVGRDLESPLKLFSVIYKLRGSGLAARLLKSQGKFPMLAAPVNPEPRLCESATTTERLRTPETDVGLSGQPRGRALGWRH